MMMKSAMTALLGAVCLLIGWIAASGFPPTVSAQEPPGDWRISQARVPSQRTWLYNTKTGKVYRILAFECSADAPNGCLIPIPVAAPKSSLEYLPTAR